MHAHPGLIVNAADRHSNIGSMVIKAGEVRPYCGGSQEHQLMLYDRIEKKTSIMLVIIWHQFSIWHQFLYYKSLKYSGIFNLAIIAQNKTFTILNTA